MTATEADRVNGAAEDAAAPEFWALALPLAASLLGGLIGSKVWPRLADSDPGAVRVRS